MLTSIKSLFLFIIFFSYYNIFVSLDQSRVIILSDPTELSTAEPEPTELPDPTELSTAEPALPLTGDQESDEIIQQNVEFCEFYITEKKLIQGTCQRLFGGSKACLSDKYMNIINSGCSE